MMQERDRGVNRGRGRGGMGPGGECLCPNCGHREPHRLGEPCYSRKCPRCETPMTRA
jgi:hypothetical protein